jgi:hypothetical protein
MDEIVFLPAGLRVTFSPQFYVSWAPNKSSLAIVFENLNLPENLVPCLRQLAGCEQSTLFSILLTTFTAPKDTFRQLLRRVSESVIRAATTRSAVQFIVQDTTRWSEPRLPIGRPMTNTQAYVLNTHDNPLPIGMPGGLYIGGADLSRGYLNRPPDDSRPVLEKPQPTRQLLEPLAKLAGRRKWDTQSHIHNLFPGIP